MDIVRNTRFEIIVNGKQSGAPEKWKEIRLTVHSTWEIGSDGEKFAVLTAIRQTYEPYNHYNIRGNQSQTPAQIGRSEGFKELRYERASPFSLPIIIVPPVMQYLRLVPNKIDNTTKSSAVL